MENNLRKRDQQRERRAMSVRRRIRGTAEKPRLSVLRTNRHLSVQVVDDENHKTLFGIGTMGKKSPFGKKSKEAARNIGAAVAGMAKDKNIERVVFDRGAYKYHGVIAEIAEGAREAGLKF